MNRYSFLGMIGAALLLIATPVRADFFGELLDLDSISVPEEGLMYDEIESDDRPDVLEMGRNRSRAQTLMRSIGHGEVRDERLVAYLNSILDRIVAVSPFPEIRPSIHLLSSTQLDAHCAPDGSIWIPVGLIAEMKSEDELAFVLAHEYSHVLFEHWDSEWFKRTQYYGIQVGRGARDLSLMLSGSDSELGRRFAAVGLTEDLQKWIRTGTLAYKFSAKILAPAWEREQEDVADAMGADLVVRAGYTPKGVMDFFDHLEAAEVSLMADDALQSASDREREQRLEQAFRDKGLDAVFRQLFEELSDIVESELEDLAKSHYPAKERRKETSNYLFRHPPVVVDPTPLPWQRSANHSVVALIDRHRVANRAGDHLKEEDIETASRLGLRAISGVGSNLSFSRLVLYNVRMAQGRTDTALRNLEIAMASPFPSAHIHVAYVKHAIMKGDWELARTRLEAADAATGGAPDLLHPKILIYGHFGDKAGVRTALRDCKDYQVQDFVEACEIAYVSVQSNLEN